MNSLVEVKNLSVTFDGQPVLEGVTFNIYPGDVLAIIGPNGSGKTVLLRTLLGLNPDYRGEINWHYRGEIGYVPQKIQFERDFPLTVQELFLFELGRGASFWNPSRGDKEAINQVLAAVRAEHLVKAQLGNLSQGELQRVLIALSILEEPKVLFLDEPAAGIDTGTEETIYHLIRELHQKRGVTAVMVSHELNVVYRYANRVLCLNRSMLCEGVPAEVLDKDTIQALFGRHAGLYKHEHRK